MDKMLAHNALYIIKIPFDMRKKKKTLKVNLELHLNKKCSFAPYHFGKSFLTGSNVGFFFSSLHIAERAWDVFGD